MSACAEKSKKVILVKNSLDIERFSETVELTKGLLKINSLDGLGVRDLESNEVLISQLVDEDGDNQFDLLIFQPKINGKSRKSYEIIKTADGDQPQSIDYCYSRFVPERTDDYAWENNRVAFRMYGPTAQKMVEDGKKGGTLSSGVDAWLKKVDYPIINKWYKKETQTGGTYHEDDGEGLDNFHVGVSRGVGGVAVKKDSSYHFSKNYTEWRTITTGPIRTSFHLEIDKWTAAGSLIKESKVISLDYGNNLSKFEVILEGTNEISAGLTLHEKDGQVSFNKEQGWVSYWQPHGNSELGTGIIAEPGAFLGYEKYDVEQKDLSNVYAHLKVSGKKITYYAGFGWKERGRFNNQQQWEHYLEQISRQLQNPLTITLSESDL
ncbi:hypothetical protein FB2170_06220 [Maribacter sp. HTCC2170]|nr:hypothetical protein FB2170_06220 [Maribacter sp. HTCC2170]